MSMRKLAAIGVSALGLALCTSSGAQAAYLPGLTNLNFVSYSGPCSPKASFTCVNPTGWSGGSGLIFIDQPGDGSNPNAACGGIYLQTYGCPTTLPIGKYNYVEADGNPSFESGFNYLVTGLTAGTTYQLSFYQAGSQQTGFGNGLHTTEQWIVSLGTSGMTFCNGCGAADSYYGGNDSTYSNPDATADVVATSPMTTPSGGITNWNFVSINLTADATTDLLSFLAWGDNGNTVNLPPIVFLTGVNTPNVCGPTGHCGVPEPASLAILGAGAAGLSARLLRKRAKKNA